jgi:hypothetical protein
MENVETAKDTPTRWQKFVRRCFPYYAPEWPPHLFKYTDGVRHEIVATISWRDRIRILLSGRIEVQVLTGTENKIGANESASRVNVLPPVRVKKEK